MTAPMLRSPTTLAGTVIARSAKARRWRATKWLEAQRDDLLPVAYYHLVFTLPAQIAPIAFPEQDRRLRPAVQGRRRDRLIAGIAANPKHLGARVGFTAVLHNLGLGSHSHHPHLHIRLCPAAACRRTVRAGSPASPASSCPSGRCRACSGGAVSSKRLAALHQAGRLAFFGELVPLADRRPLTPALAPLRRTDWVVYAKRPFAGYPQRWCLPISLATPIASAISNSPVSSPLTTTASPFRWKDISRPRR